MGYSAADVRDLLSSTWEYLQCNIDGASNDTSKADFFALNSYSWCGSTATLQSSGYNDLIALFSNTTVPVFFSEYGCNAVLPRVFDEVAAIYGPQMTPVMSGGLVYQYTQDASNYGLVNVSSNESAQLLQDYDNLQSQYDKLNITALEAANATANSTALATCSASLITASNFNSSFDIPAVPGGGQDLINNGIQNPNNGKLVAINSTAVALQVEDVQGNVLQNLAINPLPDDESNSPNPSVTTTSATASATSAKPTAKKGAASTQTVGSTSFLLAVALALVVPQI